MDDIVRQAMARWPNVPNVYGWLTLDRRGQWRLRNEYAQQHGLSGDPIRHEALIGFIERNYQCDERGCWYFQNGPQRVFVALGYAPWIVRLHQGALQTTTGQPFTLQACFADEHGNVVLAGSVAGMAADTAPALQAALLHDHDLEQFSGASTWHGEACGADLGVFHHDGRDLAIEPIAESEVPKRFGFVREPAAPAG
ncbi:DUF2946 family protein [Cupriavidus taiwanensis]|uniref:DUF2946 domain-containing protein n=1 Tax=Cupriavidus taiwanensis TaxID=164546 RepID=A0A375FKQ3_9BURK|nr:DUF2946 family protein [Cupriavidus taiwanensis]SOY54779.1 conserved hypothetical protein [Cupriavidus taiwanensis]SOY87153.1 conserved hypothetical protein [Cupriavidus taiwanensis]SOZ01449.1 conserved hypothetical protein [Cupriavidus taiwanensis]SOZ04344.1 conserved hypothetical protein [Cupriavidus taiwanensis]SPC07079.1 conserved hypothetical protein [Cupriavidus taiwanensis]